MHTIVVEMFPSETKELDRHFKHAFGCCDEQQTAAYGLFRESDAPGRNRPPTDETERRVPSVCVQPAGRETSAALMPQVSSIIVIYG